MNIRHLETFLLVADLQSFTAAARKLYMSQPAVSFQMKSLEEDLQIILFQRGDKKLGLTPAGKIVYPEAKKIVARYMKIRSGIDDLRGLKTGHLVVGASTTPGEYLLPLMIGEFRKQYPGITVKLMVAGSGQVFRWIREGDIDLGVTGSPVSAGGFSCKPWIKDDLVLIVSPEHPWAAGESPDIEEMMAEPFVLREAESGTRRSFERKIDETGYGAERMNISMELGSTRAVITAVQAGLGVGVVSELAAADVLALGKIKKIASPVDMRRLLYLVESSKSVDNPVTGEFVDFLKKRKATKLID